MQQFSSTYGVSVIESQIIKTQTGPAPAPDLLIPLSFLTDLDLPKKRSAAEKKPDKQEDKLVTPKVHGWWSSKMVMKCDSIGGMIWRAGVAVAVPSFGWWKRHLDGETIPVTIITSDGSTVCPYGSRVSDATYLGELGDRQRDGKTSELANAEALIERLYGPTEMAAIPSDTSATSEESPVAATSEKASITPIEPQDLHGDN